MDTKIETREPGQRVITGSIAAAQIEKEFPKALDELVKSIELPGFRKGKAPTDIVLKEVGNSSVWSASAETLIKEELPALLKKHALLPIVAPNVHLVAPEHGKDVSFEIFITIAPTVDIKDPASIASAGLKEVQAVDREKEEAQAKKELTTQVFAMLGKQVEGEPQLGTLTNEEVQKIGFENAAALGVFLESEAVRAVDNFENQRKRGGVAEALITKATAEIPRIIIADEVRAMLETMKADIARQGATWAQYLSVRKVNEEQIIKELEPSATKRITLDLIFAKIANEKKLQPLDEEVHRMAHALEAQGTPSDRAHQYAAEVSVREQVWKELGLPTQSLVAPNSSQSEEPHDHLHESADTPTQQ